MGSPDQAANIIRRFMKAAPSSSSSGNGVPSSSPAAPGPNSNGASQQGQKPDYSRPALILARMIDSGNLAVAQDIAKFLLVARTRTNTGGPVLGKMLDCYDLSMVLGGMARESKADSAGRLLYALYSEQSEDSQAAQTLVPFVLGTLIDHAHADWAVELGKELMYSSVEDIESGSEEHDYSVLGWCLAQMVWFGRADWAAKLCLELEGQHLEWYEHGCLMDSVAGWGDPSYSQTIINFMRDGARGGGGGGGPRMGGGGGGQYGGGR